MRRSRKPAPLVAPVGAGGGPRPPVWVWRFPRSGTTWIATPGHDDDRFAGLDVTEATTGAPIFRDALAWVDCRVVARHPGPTYTLFVGEVVAAGLGLAAEASPLVYFRRARWRLAAGAAIMT